MKKKKLLGQECMDSFDAFKKKHPKLSSEVDKLMSQSLSWGVFVMSNMLIHHLENIKNQCLTETISVSSTVRSKAKGK